MAENLKLFFKGLRYLLEDSMQPSLQTLWNPKKVFVIYSCTRTDKNCRNIKCEKNFNTLQSRRP